MWKRIILCLALLSILLHSQTERRPGEALAQPTARYRPGAVLVQFGPEMTASAADKLLSSRQLHARSEISPLKITSLQVAPGQEAATLESLRRLPGVAFAELDYAAEAAETPDDPEWNRQWSLLKINMPAAWDVVTGTTGSTIAVLDSGIDLDHPDLVPNLWTNPGEIPGNGLDDDGNGKVDDVYGWHFYYLWDGDDFVPAEDGNVQDDYGHGTHVAGIAAAATDNGIGVAGVAWGARLMAVKVLDEYGTGWYSDIAAGIVYAVDNGAKIINLSLGGGSGSETLCTAAEYAYNHGALLVASAGNSGGAVLYPAACNFVLAVAATDQADRRAGTSNFGPQVDVAAPGMEIYSTWYRGNYFTKSGTSMAAPHVSGLAHLIWSARPDLDADGVGRVITATAVDVNAGDWPGWDQYVGWGRIDAASAVSADLWVQIVAPKTVNAGESITYQLSYGNRGGMDAHDVSVTVTTSLDPGGASLPHYTIPTLPAAGGSYTQTFQVTVGPDVPGGTELITTATITSTGVEFDLLDNAAQARTRVRYFTFLPAVEYDFAASWE